MIFSICSTPADQAGAASDSPFFTVQKLIITYLLVLIIIARLHKKVNRLGRRMGGEEREKKVAIVMERVAVW